MITKEKRTKSSKKHFIMLLLMVSLVVTTGTFAYWASYVEGTSSEAVETLQIGTADGVDTEFILHNEFNTGGYLVPQNQLLNSLRGSVDTVYLSYDLQWVEQDSPSQLQGTITTGDVTVSHNVFIYNDDILLQVSEYAHIYDLINVLYSEDNVDTLTLDAEAETFYFTITLEEPKNQEEYNLISNAVITVQFSFDIRTNDVITADIVNDEEVFTNRIVLNGESEMILEVGQEYSEPGYTIYDVDGTILEGYYQGYVNGYELGTYEITYNAYSNQLGDFIGEVTRTVIVVDTTAPDIIINGEETVTVLQGTYYSDWGAYALDNSNEFVTVTTEGVNQVDVSSLGTYEITYYAVDASGNETSVTRTVIVVEQTNSSFF